MSKYNIDWCPRYKCGIITSNNIDAIKYAFSVEDPTARFQYGGRRGVSARRYVITHSGRFAAGLLVDILRWITSNDSEPTIIVTKEFKSHILTKFSYKDNPLEQMTLNLRPYQQEVVRSCLRQGRGVCVVATAGGKTLIMSTLIQTILSNEPNKTILVILPPQLVEQTYVEFITHGINAGLISKWDGTNTLCKASVVIASNSILLSKKQDVKWIHNIDVLIVDECHKIKKATKINKLVSKISTDIKFGFTGTMPDDKIDEWNIVGTFGPVIYEKSSAELRNEKYIADAAVKIINITYDDAPVIRPDRTNPTKAYKAELEFLMTNVKRNKIIASICKKADNNILILVDRIAHGDIIKTVLHDTITDKQIFFIRGSVGKDEREDIKAIMEEHSNVICIAMSSILSTGVNIKNLHYIMFASGGKAKTRIIQSIGRGLRLHRDKLLLVVYDITDNLLYGNKHHQKRIQLYNKEQLKYNVYYI